MKAARTLLGALALIFCVAALPVWAGKERDIPLSKVPKKILAIAQKTVPGIQFTEAEVRKTPKGLLYEVEGVVKGQKYELNITARGKVIRIIKEDDEDEEEERNAADPAN